MNDSQPTIEEIRKLLLGQGKKQYEFVKFIFTPAELLAEKPFILLSILLQRFKKKSRETARNGICLCKEFK